MKAVSGVFATVGALVFVVVVVLRIINFYSYEIDIGGHLKRAADANTIQIAEQELNTAITNMEARGYTKGYTSLFIKTPDEDVEFWYNNVKAAYNSLKEIPPNATELEKSNMLIKLRETLTDHTSNGTTITDPAGISVYPYNMSYFFATVTSIFTVVSFGIVFLALL